MNFIIFDNIKRIKFSLFKRNVKLSNLSSSITLINRVFFFLSRQHSHKSIKML